MCSIAKDGEHMDDQKEEREGESGGEQTAAGGCEGQQVTFLPTVRLAAFGQGGLGPIRPNARLMFRMAKGERSSYQQFSLGCPYRNKRLISQ